VNADAAERFWASVEAGDPDDCWPWTGFCLPNGYGRFNAGGKKIYVHRFSYELHFGPVPSGLVVDHDCHNQDLACEGGFACLHRRCANPAHLDAITYSENTKRGAGTRKMRGATHCRNGHPYSDENTYRWEARPHIRYCRTCHRESHRALLNERGML
jgi:hypothetical protein